MMMMTNPKDKYATTIQTMTQTKCTTVYRHTSAGLNHGQARALSILSCQVHRPAHVRFHGLFALAHQIAHELMRPSAPAVAATRRRRTLSAASACLRVLLHILLSEVDRLVQARDSVCDLCMGCVPCPASDLAMSAPQMGVITNTPQLQHCRLDEAAVVTTLSGTDGGGIEAKAP